MVDARPHGWIELSRSHVRGDRGVEQAAVAQRVHEARVELRIRRPLRRTMEQQAHRLVGVAVIDHELCVKLCPMGRSGSSVSARWNASSARARLAPASAVEEENLPIKRSHRASRAQAGA